ncbi:MAG: hypothetical protein JF614_11905 [Acidobacteria bacterium]|nr:hypothetical protein [Acidobacteriota bacterium]
MSSINAFSGIVRDWEGLLAACKDRAGEVANAEALRSALEGLLVEGKGLKDLQESLASGRQRATQELGGVIERGKETARRLRGIVKGNLGTRNELLVQFNIAPIRKRGPRKKAAAAQPPGSNPPA